MKHARLAASMLALFFLAALPVAAKRTLVWSDARVEAGLPQETARDKAITIANGSGPVWSVTFADVSAASGQGFDHASLGAARRACLIEALEWFGRGITTSHPVRVYVYPSATSGNYFALGASYFDSVHGVMDSDSFKAAALGVDAYPTYPDLMLRVNFQHDYFLGQGTIGGDQFDLRTKIYTAVVRGMGVLTLANQNGGSRDVNGYRTRTRWETLLENGNGVRLFNPASGVFNGTAAWLISSANGVWYGGAWGAAAFEGRIPVHAPNPYVNDVSLISWNLTAATQAGLITSQDEAGEVREYLAPWEYEVLRDLGYTVDLPYACLDAAPWLRLP